MCTRKKEDITPAFCTFKITVKEHVSQIQSTEWNSTSKSKQSDRKIDTSKNAPI